MGLVHRVNLIWEEAKRSPSLMGFSAFTAGFGYETAKMIVLDYDCVQHPELLLSFLTTPAVAGMAGFAFFGFLRMASPQFSFHDLGVMMSEWKKIRKIDPALPKSEGRIHASLRMSTIPGFWSKEKQEARVRKEPDCLMLLSSVARNHFKEGNYDEGCLALADFLDVAGNKTITRRWLNIPVSKYVQPLNKYFSPSDASNLFCDAAFQVFLGRRDLAYRTSMLGRNLSDIFDSSARREAYVLHAMLSSAMISGRAAEDWRAACEIIRKDPVWERIGETRSIVRTIKDSKFLSKSILFKEGDLESLLQETENISRLRGFVGEDAVLPEVLYTSEEDSYIVMRFLQGDTLLQRFEQGDYSSVEGVLGLLARIHEYVPEGAERLSIPYYVRSRLISEHFGIPRDLARSIVSHYRPVYDSLQDSPWVYNKDAHPENWIIDGDDIGIIDCEGSALVPAQFDLVNLLEYGDFFSDGQKKDYIDDYLSSFREPFDRSSFMLGYWNSVIHRMIGLSSAWSSPIRPGMHGKRLEAIFRALHAIDIIESDFSGYYGLHSEDYDGLRMDFSRIAGLIS